MSRHWPLTGLLLALLFLPTVAHGEIRSIHQDLTVDLNPSQRSLAVSARLQIEGNGPLTLRLAGNFVVTAFRIDGQASAARRMGDQWLIDLKGGQQHQLALDYRGGLGELESSPEGSFLAPGSGWHPTFDGLAFSYRLDITVPARQRAVVPGKLIEEKSTDDTYRAVFTSEAPLAGIVLIAGPYGIEQVRHGKIRLRTYFDPDISALSKGYLDATADYLDFYEKWIGPYPYSAFSIVSGLLPVGLGYPGLTFMGKRVLALPFIKSTSLGHEVLHNWWGNGVDVDLSGGNWSEGLTTFMADYTYALRRSDAAAKDMRIAWLRDYAALPPARDHAVVSFISRSRDAEQIIGYNKVAFFFHMLRRSIGRAAFDQGLRLFWRAHALGIASWDDLQKAFEQASSRDLRQFFRQWLRQSGAPKLVLKTAAVIGNKVTFDLVQAAKGYRLSVPVQVTTATGLERFDVIVEDGSNRLEYTAAAPIQSLTIDPDFDIFRHLGPAETPPILRDVTLAMTTRTLVFAEGDGDMTELAVNLAARLTEGRSRPEIASDTLPNTPLLLIGDSALITAFLNNNGLPPTPTDLAGRGSVRAWVARSRGNPVLVVEADDAAALRAVLRPLPHYRRQGYVVFQGAKAIAKGARPASHGPLSVRFGG